MRILLKLYKDMLIIDLVEIGSIYYILYLT
jgi:hypothetical protein